MSYRGPAEIAKEIILIGKKKASTPISSLIVLSVLAGVYVAFAAQAMIMVTFDGASALGVGLTRLIAGSVFSFGLILVILAGAELFTGNNLMTVGFLDKKFSLKTLLKNWGIVYVGNFVGAFLVALLVFYSGLWQISGTNAIGKYALSIASKKVQLGFLTALIRGIGANWLVCIAVWLSISGERTMDKILGVIFPIATFVILGFEHSIANMFFLPVGLMLKGVIVSSTASQLTISSAVLQNLIPVTIGNLIGGVLFVAFPYWFVYVRNHKKQYQIAPHLVEQISVSTK